MTEIKFRWVGRNRKFDEIEINENLTINKIIDGSVMSFFNRSNRGESGNCEFLSEDLFTGEKDAFGKDLYRNDIVTIKDFGHNYKIEFENGAFVLYHTSISNFNGSFLKWGNICRLEESGLTCKKVGNIYQNKELLHKP